ncbi:mannan-binding lectin [Myxococcota bacterium]|nr:mannan-binding lectin [Myxococcota bacterium]
MKKMLFPFVSVAVFFSLMTFSPAASAQVIEVKAGPLRTDAQARVTCPGMCKKVSREWNGQWRVLPAGMAVCSCAPANQEAQRAAKQRADKQRVAKEAQRAAEQRAAKQRTAKEAQQTAKRAPVITIDVEAGRIRNNEEAKRNCPAVCQKRGLVWTGQWRVKRLTTGLVSVCNCRR